MILGTQSTSVVYLCNFPFFFAIHRILLCGFRKDPRVPVSQISDLDLRWKVIIQGGREGMMPISGHLHDSRASPEQPTVSAEILGELGWVWEWLGTQLVMRAATPVAKLVEKGSCQWT